MRILNYIESANVSFRIPWVDLMKELKSRGVEQVLLCRPGGNMEETARENGIETYTWKPAVTNFPPANFKFRSIVRRISPDIIHTRLSSAANISGFWGKRMKIPTIAMFDVTSKLKYYRNADYYTACSQWAKEGMTERGIDPSKIDVTYNSIDVEKYSPVEEERISFRKKHSISPNSIAILGIGLFVEGKGFHILIDSLAQLVQDTPNIHLLLAGGGPMRNDYMKQIEKSGLSGKVTISDEYVKDVRPWLWASDIFVLTSLKEAFGIVILEAMAAGLLTIVTDSGGPSEIVRDGLDGFIIPSGDASAISEAIRKFLILSPEDKSTILENSKKRLEYFSSAALADRLINIYEKVLSGSFV